MCVPDRRSGEARQPLTHVGKIAGSSGSVGCGVDGRGLAQAGERVRVPGRASVDVVARQGVAYELIASAGIIPSDPLLARRTVIVTVQCAATGSLPPVTSRPTRWTAEIRWVTVSWV